MIWWLVFTLSIWLSVGLDISKIKNQEKDYPNQGITNSWKNSRDVGLKYGLIGALIGGLFIGLIFWLHQGWMMGLFYGLKTGLILGLYYGVINSLLYGLLAVIQHYILRIFLSCNPDVPLNQARFLSHAAKHRFIIQVGGRYRFMHPLLRKHFAQMSLR